MGNLSHLLGQMGAVDKRLKQATEYEGGFSDMLEDRFEKISENMSRSMERLISENKSLQTAAVQQLVSQAVTGIYQSQAAFLNAVERISDEVRKNSGSVKAEVGSASKNMDGKMLNMAAKLDDLYAKLSKSIGELPKSFPEQVKTDLSGISKEIKAVGRLVQSIPAPMIPKPVDPTPALKELEKTIKSRVHTFHVERDPYDGLIKSVRVEVE